MNFSGKVGLVTGGGSGIGAAVAEGYAQRGGAIVVADFNEASARRVAEGIAATGGKAMAVKADAFQRSFARLQPATVRRLNQAVLEAIVELGLEDARQLRVDTMVVESDIHYPTDSTLLWDGACYFATFCSTA